MNTIDSDPTGGGDPIRSIGQYENSLGDKKGTTTNALKERSDLIWLRFEPFILHVACQSLSAAGALMAAARPAFKNVGLTTWKDSRYLVAIVRKKSATN